MDCKVDKPYPRIMVKEKNPYYAKLLYEAYAGMISELSAVTLYSYQNFEMFDFNIEFSNMIKEIAIVEMHHLEILGKLINLLGTTPIYMNSENLLWSSSNIIYNNNIIDMLNIDILKEEESIKYYKFLKTKIEDRNIITIINRIILDEEKHLECFRMFRQKYLNC